MSGKNINGYSLMRSWFEYVLDHPDQVTGNHSALYAWLVEINNRLDWREKFQITAWECMAGMSAKSRTTYSKCLQDLVDWGFVFIVVKSRNQHQANVISLHKKYASTDASTDAGTSQAPEQSLVKHVDYSQTSKTDKPHKTIKDRENDFKKSIEQYASRYTSNMLNAFFSYWTERNKNGHKMRFELQQVFDVERRLTNWKQNEENYPRNGNRKQLNITATVKEKEYGQL